VRGHYSRGWRQRGYLGDIWESDDSGGVGFNDSYSGDVVLEERQGVELCLTTTGAEKSRGTVTAG